MKKTITLTMIAIAGVMTLSACTHRDAAMIGAVIGHSVGAPLGTAAVALDETFKTAGDVVEANPRYDGQTRAPKNPANSRPSRQGAHAGGENEDETHYYKAEVLVKTHGPASIESIDFHESEDVTKFWK